jgi:DNA-binding PadR family transcriptional regulator
MIGAKRTSLRIRTTLSAARGSLYPALKLLENLGYIFRRGVWDGPAPSEALTDKGDALHDLLTFSADALEGQKKRNTRPSPRHSKPTR